MILALEYIENTCVFNCVKVIMTAKTRKHTCFRLFSRVELGRSVDALGPVLEGSGPSWGILERSGAF